jgi:hypothetical protein
VNGYNLVALIFAREVSDNLTSLVKTIDKQIGESSVRNKAAGKLGVFVIFCSDDPGLQKQLENLIAKQGLKNIVISLSADKSAGPRRYKIAKEADVTVVVYDKGARVVTNYVLDSDDLTANKAKDIVRSLKKVLP